MYVVAAHCFSPPHLFLSIISLFNTWHLQKPLILVFHCYPTCIVIVVIVIAVRLISWDRCTAYYYEIQF
ncbi:predicted protein [Lichtheimia corymbifera JMRC:FSU:9682]|uniref:Uncharacterized protein n=1 Tax=Lichtheimia corymbifera JMRC:FSU:9682 TaxID=1263082 RepID=A0A068RQA0_9FUNG|nr:predicted protein [Lichtheimia corymbifera JMRC:FSU:9682]